MARDTVTLLPVDEALDRLLRSAPILASQDVPLVAAVGRRLTDDVLAQRTQPAADLSAMDGYAVRSADLPGPLTVIGEIAAGDPAIVIAPRQAARIFTGAPLPAGADCVLIQEDAVRDGDLIRSVGEAPMAGAHVRPMGSDFTAGTLLLEAETFCGAAAVALAAIGGHGTLPVRRRPKVALISTGNELVLPGDPAEGVQLPASNSPMLAAMLAGLPVDVEDRGIVRDDRDALVAAFRAAGAWADVIVTTGGASVGDHDLVRPAFVAAGATIDFWRIAMKPGKPLMAGRMGDAVILGLPGNPVSAFVTATVFLLPLLRRMADVERSGSAIRHMALNAPLDATGARREYVRAQAIGNEVRPLVGQDSAALRQLHRADLLIVREPFAPPAAAGDLVAVLPIA